jgi:hypothetical protein
MPRNPRTSITRETTEVERIKIVEAYAAGKSYRAMEEEFDIGHCDGIETKP